MNDIKSDYDKNMDMDVVSPDDFDFDEELLQKEAEEKQWQMLVEQIYRRNVIPVIGPYWNGPDTKSVEDKIFDKIANKCGFISGKCRSFSNLINSWQYKRVFHNLSIYSLINHALEKEAIIKDESLKNFLSLPYFPFVITTTWDPSVENVMRDTYGDKLRVMTFNNASENDDIAPDELDLGKPTVYYIFGKANEKGKKYVVTDYDLLAFSRTWLSEIDCSSKKKPFNLSCALSNKFLLVLGCEYQSWLFKFFWYAMKDEVLTNSTETIGMTARPKTDEELIDFLINSHIFTKNMSAVDLAKKIKSKIDECIASGVLSKFDYPEKHCDVFLSYSRADSGVVKKLYDILTSKGLNVWYDKKNLKVGDKFMNDIRHSIKTARLFVPVISENIRKQFDELHVYREEWNYAVKIDGMRGKYTYILPLCEKDFNINDDLSNIPETICSSNVFEYDNSNLDLSLNQFADAICEIINQ